MQFFSVIGPLAAIAGLVSAAMIPTASLESLSHERAAATMDPTDPKMIGRIANPLDYASPMGKFAKRAEPGFYFCNHADYRGLCFRDRSAFGTCVTVKDDLADVPDQFGNSVSSVSVNEGTHCTLFRDALCEGASKDILFPGERNLFFQDFNDVMSSFRCEEI